MLDATHLFYTQIAAGVSLVIFALFAWGVLRARGQIAASRSWRKVEGAIVASGVEQPASHFSDDLNDAKPVVRYRYRVGEQDSESDRIKFGGEALTTRVLAGAAAARYPVGARVDVYVDPDDSKKAALEPSNADNLVVQIALTVTFGLIALVLGAHALAGKVVYTSNGVPLFAFAAPILALLIAAAAFAEYLRGRRRASASARWPTTTGKIVNSSVIEENISEADDNNKSIIRTTTRYYLDLRYAYEVAHRDFVGATRNWAWTPIFPRRDMAEKEASLFSPGQMVVIYYDPAQPGSAVLEPGNRRGALAPLVVSAIAAVIGAAILAFLVEVGFSS
jgi:hypothetical protein